MKKKNISEVKEVEKGDSPIRLSAVSEAASATETAPAAETASVTETAPAADTAPASDVDRAVPTAGSYPFVPKPTPVDGLTPHVRAVADLGFGDVNPFD